ncbi:MAG: hypothetical protein ABI200_05570 [Gaiellales bacterium]
MTLRALFIAVALPFALMAALHEHPSLLYHANQAANSVIALVT